MPKHGRRAIDQRDPEVDRDRLKHGEVRIAEAYPDTTVVFTDLVGFTPWAQRTDPALVVALLDDLFGRFESSGPRHGIEKIKTVGDAYMAVAGAQSRTADHAYAAIGFARACSPKRRNGGRPTGSSFRSGWGSRAGPWSAA